MFFLIFSLTFLFFAGLAFLFGALKGRKYVWQFSVSRIILNVLSALVAAALTGWAATGASRIISELFRRWDALDGIRELGLNIDVLSIVVVVATSVTAGLIFVPVFYIVRGFARFGLKALTQLLVMLTVKKTDSGEAVGTEKRQRKYDCFKTPKSNIIGAMCGGVCGLITLIVMSIPTVGALGTVNDIVYKPLDATQSVALNTVAEIVDASANNVGTAVVKYTGGQILFDAMTYAEAGEISSVTVKEDLATVGDIAAVAIKYDLFSELVDSPEDALTNEDCTSEILLLLLENPRLSPVIDTVSDFAMEILLEAVGAPEDVAPMYDSFLSDMASVDKDERDILAKKYANVFDSYGLRVDEVTKLNAVEARLSGADMREWARENVASDEGQFVRKTELVSISTVTDGREEVTDAKKESRALARSISALCNMADSMELSDIQDILRKLGPALDAFKQTQTVGTHRTELLLKGLLQSKKIHDEIGLSVLDATDTAMSICENSQEKGFEPLLISLSKAVDAVSAASDPEKDTNAAVREMLDDLTPEASKVLQTMTTPSVVQTYDISDKSAEPVADMISDTFGNLSDAKENGMSDEEFDRESAAVSNMMDILMAVDQTKSVVFGGNSVTGITAEDYVNNIMDSKVMSQTIVENVYADGENAVSDPLKSNRELADSEKAQLMDALSSRWNNSDRTPETEKKLIATAAVLNLHIQIVNGVVCEVAPQA